MRAHLLLGPAGSGKTHRVLAAIRAALAAAPDGPPLILLAPKQATFQLERQLLEPGAPAGWSRLFILSFDRLTQFVLDALGHPPAALLPGEGRVMVLRALLGRHRAELEVFRGSARLAGFAQELAGLLRDLRRHGLAPADLERAASDATTPPTLAAKLRDVARLQAAHRAWLAGHRLTEADELPDLAAAALDAARGAAAAAPAPLAAELWLDGFAEMTPQELALLAALAPFCGAMTLAFCLEGPPRDDEPWLSPWTLVAQTARLVAGRLAALPGVTVTEEILPRGGDFGRFAGRPALAQLEAGWGRPGSVSEAPADPGGVRLVACAHPEEEAACAARAILAHVHDGGRYRECAVIVRAIETHADAFRRVFARYAIPFFLDRREPLAHHPAAELTRGALHTLARGWRHEDWFGALKTGLADAADDEVDRLENAALAHGWDGPVWTKPLPGADAGLERLRQRVVGPFAALGKALGERPSGRALAAALRGLWAALHLEDRLQAWGDEPPGTTAGLAPPEGVHRSAWEELGAWADGLELGFGDEALPLAEWLPVLEAGLADLTAGVIPPAQDQVLVGAVDRGRQPELRLAVVAGFNDGLFPAAPGPRGLFTEAEHDGLAARGLRLGPDARRRLGHERYYAYIALTRSGGRLLVTWSAADARGRALNPSPLAAQFRRVLPGRETEAFDPLEPARAPRHASELAARRLRAPAALPDELVPWPEHLRRLAAYVETPRLSPALAAALAGPVLRTSATALEKFAACPFQFFAGLLLRLADRDVLEADPARLGTLRHAVLAAYLNRRLARTPVAPIAADDAAALLHAAMDEVLERPEFAPWRSTPEFGERAAQVRDALARFVRVEAGWSAASRFVPAAAELRFGGRGALPAWRLDLGEPGEGRALELSGSVDRLDVFTDAAGTRHALVLDYKSTATRPEPARLAAGLQLQLPLYLAALAELTAGSPGPLTPAGAFYVPLKPQRPRDVDPADAAALAEAGRAAHRGAGLARAARRPDLDTTGHGSGQFPTVKTRLAALPDEEFAALLRHAAELARGFARRVLAGDLAPAPYRHAGETACERCDFLGVCRHDRWTRGYRALRPPAAAPPAQAG